MPKKSTKTLPPSTKTVESSAPAVSPIPQPPTLAWQATEPPDQLLTIRQVSALTGMSTRWIGRRLSDGRIARIKLGRSTRIRLSEVKPIIERGMA